MCKQEALRSHCSSEKQFLTINKLEQSLIPLNFNLMQLSHACTSSQLIISVDIHMHDTSSSCSSDVPLPQY